MKTHLNLKNSKLDNCTVSISKLKSIYVIEEDLDTNNLNNANFQCGLGEDAENTRLKKIERYKYLCYLRSMDDMV